MVRAARLEQSRAEHEWYGVEAWSRKGTASSLVTVLLRICVEQEGDTLCRCRRRWPIVDPGKCIEQEVAAQSRNGETVRARGAPSGDLFFASPSGLRPSGVSRATAGSWGVASRKPPTGEERE